MSGQDTGKFREVSGGGHVETITAEDGRIEFVIEEGSSASVAAAAPSAPRTAPSAAVEIAPPAVSLIDRARALPRWMVAAPIAALLFALALGLGLSGGGGEGAGEEEGLSSGGFRPYGGGPVDGKARGADVRAAPAAQRAVEAPAVEEGVDDAYGAQAGAPAPFEVREAVEAQEVPVVDAPAVPNTMLRPQELNTINPGMTDEQRKLLQQNLNPPQLAAPPDDIVAPVAEPVEEAPTYDETPPAEAPAYDETPQGELLPNGGYQEPYEDRDPSTIAPPPSPEMMVPPDTAPPARD